MVKLIFSLMLYSAEVFFALLMELLRILLAILSEFKCIDFNFYSFRNEMKLGVIEVNQIEFEKYEWGKGSNKKHMWITEVLE